MWHSAEMSRLLTRLWLSCICGRSVVHAMVYTEH
jgi:hypothetical protein